MIDTNELRRLAQATNEHSDDRAEILAEFYAVTQSDTIIELLDRLEAVEKERDALRAKIEATERQEPVAWMLNCQTLGGDTGWLLSWTQSGVGMCNRLSGEENERKLYTIPGAQPAPSINPAALSPVINWLRNGCDPMKAADELEMLAASPEARP